MGILDDVVINAKSAAEAVGKKAGQIVDVSKLRINVAELNAEISKRYEALGEYVYRRPAGSSWQRMPRLWANGRAGRAGEPAQCCHQGIGG